MPPPSKLFDQFGDIDIYLFDLLLKGRLPLVAQILDAGCGGGRNLIYLLREGHRVFAVDRDPAAIDFVRTLAAHLPASNFQVSPIETMSWPVAFDLVISSAVLHFADDEDHFEAMLNAMWRVVKPDGFLFCRLASSIGIEKQVQKISGRRFSLPDGSERFLVDEKLLLHLTDKLEAELVEPLKTTIVQSQRSMTTWILRRRAGYGSGSL